MQLPMDRGVHNRIELMSQHLQSLFGGKKYTSRCQHSGKGQPSKFSQRHSSSKKRLSHGPDSLPCATPSFPPPRETAFEIRPPAAAPLSLGTH